MSLVRSTAIIGSMTMLSRIAGFVRDVLIANLIGASGLSDAFFVAFKLPNFFRRLFAEGAFNAAFVPQFAGILTTEGKEAAIRFAAQAMSVLLVALLALNAVFLTFMPWLLQWFAPGFAEASDKYELTVTLARICFPYILFISLVSLLGGVLNSLGRFAAVAAAPIMLNLCLITAVLFFADDTETPAHALAWGVFAAGLTQFAWLVFSCIKAGALPALPWPQLTPPVRKLFRIMAPAALGAGVAQVNLFIDIILASYFEDGVSFLYYADRLNELPIGVIGVAVGTALLPMLSKQIRAGEHAAARHSLNRAIELILLFGLPAAAALMIIPESLTRVLYQHGAFSEADTLATYTAMMAYAAGLPAFLLVKVFAPGFYASEDTKTPFVIACICVLVNLTFNLILMQFFAHVGLAMATSIAGWLNVGMMVTILHRRGLFTPDRALKSRFPRLLLSALLMGVWLWLLQDHLSDWLSDELPHKIEALGLLVVSGMLIYAFAVLLLRAFRLKDMKSYLSK